METNSRSRISWGSFFTHCLHFFVSSHFFPPNWGSWLIQSQHFMLHSQSVSLSVTLKFFILETWETIYEISHFAFRDFSFPCFLFLHYQTKENKRQKDKRLLVAAVKSSHLPLTRAPLLAFTQRDFAAAATAGWQFSLTVFCFSMPPTVLSTIFSIFLLLIAASRPST